MQPKYGDTIISAPMVTKRCTHTLVTYTPMNQGLVMITVGGIRVDTAMMARSMITITIKITVTTTITTTTIKVTSNPVD